MNPGTCFKRYFLSDLIIITLLTGLIYLPGKVFAETGGNAPGQDTIAGQCDHGRGLVAPDITAA